MTNDTKSIQIEVLLVPLSFKSHKIYSIAGPQQPKDTVDSDSIEHYKIAKSFGKVSFTHTTPK